MTRLKWIVLAVLVAGLGGGALAACDPVKVDAATDGGVADGSTPGGDGALPDSGGGPCTSSAQCSAPLGVCAPDGVCVACATSSDCPLDTASVCDQGSRACRGCAADNECPGAGVCVETEGRCVASDQVAYVTMMGNDTGTCTHDAPCATIAYAVSKLGGRKALHVLGGSLSTSTITLADVGTLAIDGEDTTLSGTGTTSTFILRGASDVTIEGFRVNVPGTNPTGGPDIPAIIVSGAGCKATLDGLIFGGSGGTAVSAVLGSILTMTHSHVGTLSTNNTFTIASNSARTTLTDNLFEMTIVEHGNSGSLTVARNRFESTRDGSVHASGGVLVMQNNLVIHRDGFNDSISANGLSAGSTIRFNTIVNTTATPSDGAALGCDGSVQVTSNIFAYNSMHPIVGSSCATRYSVFDDVALTSAGTGNQVTGIETIFVNRAGGNYHLANSSVARGGAEPGLTTMVKQDFEGNARPSPAGSDADCGAFEAP